MIRYVLSVKMKKGILIQITQEVGYHFKNKSENNMLLLRDMTLELGQRVQNIKAIIKINDRYISFVYFSCYK